MSNVPKLRFKEFSGEWEEKTLGSISKQISYGLTVRPEYIETGIPLISARELRNGKIDYDIASKISEDSYNDLSEKAKAKKGDIFLTKTGTVGLSAYVNEDFLIAITQNIAVIRVSNENYNHQFILQTFKTQNFYRTAISKVNQSTIMDLQLQDIRKLSVFFPSKEEQEKIASFLISIDTKIEQLIKKEQLLQQYKKSVMQKIFNQEIRFKDDDGSEFCEWEEKKLGNICKLQGGFAFKSEQFRKSGIPIIRISNISNINNYIDRENIVYYDAIPNDRNFSITNGDLIVAMSGATTGKASIYNLNEKAYLNQRVGLFRANKDKLYYGYLVQFVFSKLFYRQLDTVLVAGAQPNISSKDIEDFKFNLPCLKEQIKIANFLSSIDSKIEQVQKQINSTKEFKKALLQQMFV